MSETATKKASGYKVRKAARLRGEPMKSRTHEPAPWFTWSLKQAANVLEDGRVRLERELREFGERDAKKRRERAERAALFAMLEEEGFIAEPSYTSAERARFV